MLVPTGIMSVQMEDAFQSMLFVKTTMRWEPAHLVTGVLHCQVATASQQPKTILTAKAETPSLMPVSNATMPTGSMEPSAPQSTLFAPLPISETVNVSPVTPVILSLVEAVESLSGIQTAKSTITQLTLALSAQ